MHKLVRPLSSRNCCRCCPRCRCCSPLGPVQVLHAAPAGLPHAALLVGGDVVGDQVLRAAACKVEPARQQTGHARCTAHNAYALGRAALCLLTTLRQPCPNCAVPASPEPAPPGPAQQHSGAHPSCLAACPSIGHHPPRVLDPVDGPSLPLHPLQPGAHADVLQLEQPPPALRLHGRACGRGVGGWWRRGRVCCSQAQCPGRPAAKAAAAWQHSMHAAGTRRSN